MNETELNILKNNKIKTTRLNKKIILIFFSNGINKKLNKN